MYKANSWQPIVITTTSFLYGLFIISLGIIESINNKNIIFIISTLWFGLISICSSFGAYFGLITKDHLTTTSSIILLTIQNIFTLITSTLSLFEVVYNYRIYNKHKAFYLFIILEDYEYLGMILFSTISFLSLFSLLYMWTFYDSIADDNVANLLGHPFNMTSEFWHYPTSRTSTSKLFTPRKPIHKLATSPVNNIERNTIHDYEV